MKTLPILTLKRGKEAALNRRHPWVFSGALVPPPAGLERGTWIHLAGHDGTILATGTYSTGSIAVRVAAFERVDSIETLLKTRLEQAWNRRKALGFGTNPRTTLFRLFYGEGDGLPGLVIDVFGATAVVQCHDNGLHTMRHALASVLMQLPGLNLQGVYDRSAESLHRQDVENGLLEGSLGDSIVHENGIAFEVDLTGGQKTGFFIDQRNNRALVGQYASGKTVLNAFSYTGGFSLYALQGGAKEVVSVDISAPAIALANRNADLNGWEDRHTGLAEDVFDHLKKVPKGHYDLIILDPPAFAKSKNTSHNALQGYKRINQMAMARIRPGGLLFTFSCSQHISPSMFEGAVRAAAIETGRPAAILHRLTQPEDHPVNLFHPEGEYLKGLVVQVD